VRWSGTVVASSDENDPLLSKKVFLVPTRGWDSDPYGPESKYGGGAPCSLYRLISLRYRFGILGGGSNPPIGTFIEYVAVERKYVIPTPDHLSSEEAAAWPVGGVTAWRFVLSPLQNFECFNREFRAAIINAGAGNGRNLLITGAGGGVALLAVQLSVAKGTNVFVTSGSDEKIQKLLPFGVKGVVNYKHSEGIPA